MSRRRKSIAPRSSRPRTSGFCSVPRSRARTCALPCASVTASGATNASRRALTSPSTSAWMFSGAKPGPSVARPASFIVEPSTVTARSWTPTPPGVEREPSRADDDVAVEVLRAQADGVGDRHLAAQVGLVQRAARLQLDAQIAGHPLERAAAPRNGCSSSRSRWPDRLPEIALPSSRPATTRSPPSVLKCASSSTIRVAVDADVQRARRLDAHALDGGLAVRALDGAGDRQPQLGQQDVQRQRPRRVDVDGDAAADDAARVAERHQLGRERLDLDAAEVDLGVDRRPLGRQRRLRVDVEAVEQAAVNARRRARADGPTRVGDSARCPAPSFTPRTITSARSTSPASSGRSGRAADVQLRAGEAADRHVGRRDAGQARERQPVEHHVEIEILVGEGDLAAGCPARRRRRA